jgi:hypothetical protein
MHPLLLTYCVSGSLLHLAQSQLNSQTAPFHSTRPAQDQAPCFTYSNVPDNDYKICCEVFDLTQVSVMHM